MPTCSSPTSPPQLKDKEKAAKFIITGNNSGRLRDSLTKSFITVAKPPLVVDSGLQVRAICHRPVKKEPVTCSNRNVAAADSPIFSKPFLDEAASGAGKNERPWVAAAESCNGNKPQT